MKKLTNIFLLFLLVLCAILFYFRDDLKIEPQVVFIGSMIIFYIGMLVNLWNFDLKMAKNSINIANIHKKIGHLNLTYIRRYSFDASFSELTNIFCNSKQVLEVHNTIIGPVITQQIKNYGEYRTAVDMIIKSGCKWYDLITFGSTPRLLGVIKTYLKVKNNYYFNILDNPDLNKLTFLNFILIKGIDSMGIPYKYTMIGWENSLIQEDKTDEIIRISNNDIYDRYLIHFNSLWDKYAINDESIKHIKKDSTLPHGLLKVQLSLIFKGKEGANTNRKCKKCKKGTLIAFDTFSSETLICDNFGNGCSYIS